MNLYVQKNKNKITTAFQNGIFSPIPFPLTHNRLYMASKFYAFVLDIIKNLHINTFLQYISKVSNN